MALFCLAYSVFVTTFKWKPNWNPRETSHCWRHIFILISLWKMWRMAGIGAESWLPPEKEPVCSSCPTTHPLPHSLVWPGGHRCWGPQTHSSLWPPLPSLPCSYPTSLLVEWTGNEQWNEQWNEQGIAVLTNLHMVCLSLCIVNSLFCEWKLKMHTFLRVLRGLEIYQAQTVAQSNPLVNTCWMIESATTSPRCVGTRGHLFGCKRRHHRAAWGY